MKQAWFRAILRTLFAMAVSLLTTHIAMSVFLGEFQPVGYLIALLVPLFISLPMSFYVEHQRQWLAAANRELNATRKQLETALAQKEFEARHDSMTGLTNREHFVAHLGKCRRKSDVGAVLILDVDHFKTVNDTYGHHVGDRALLAIVSAITGSVREGDVVGRMGGEEFSVFLPEVDEEATLIVAERIRQAVEETDFEAEQGKKLPLSISIGGALSTGSETALDLIRLADARMYAAKRAGRNQVVLRDDDSSQSPAHQQESAAA